MTSCCLSKMTGLTNVILNFSKTFHNTPSLFPASTRSAFLVCFTYVSEGNSLTQNHVCMLHRSAEDDKSMVARETTTEGAERARECAKQAMQEKEKAKYETGESAEGVASAPSAAEKTGYKVEEAVEKVEERAKDYVNDAKEKAKETVKGTTDKIKKAVGGRDRRQQE